MKVLDFGLAKALEPTTAIVRRRRRDRHSPTLTPHATQLGVILGTAAYMSPEQARGRAVDKRADIWAFGAVLYEMLTGRRAFEGEETTDVLASVLGAPSCSRARRPRRGQSRSSSRRKSFFAAPHWAPLSQA